jgi:hypothetical protein
MLGADPEMVLLNPPELVNGSKLFSAKVLRGHEKFYGFDHNGFVLEPHPAPNFSAREVCKNIKASMDVITHHFANYRHRAGAYLSTPQRVVTLGGHVHLDMPSLTREQIQAMDVFCGSLEHLDILPASECTSRAARGNYGHKSDIRAERGRVEYRSMCSWLFSRKTSMLCITGIKLCAVAPKTLKKMQSIAALVSWLEGFKGADDDVDWILDKNYFGVSMTAKPDANVQRVWQADPDKGKELLTTTNKEAKAAPQMALEEYYQALRNLAGIQQQVQVAIPQRQPFANNTW